MSPDDELETARRKGLKQRAPGFHVPGGEGSTARRYLRRDEILRRCAPGSTRHPPGGLGAGSARRSGSWQRLAVRVTHQAICTAATWTFD